MICPTVSVVITAYNAECWIAETLNSVLNQTYNDYEVIVVDDGSTDHTANVIQQFGEKVHYIYTENVGQPAARNIGIRAARGEWIAFNDADDLWKREKLSKQMEQLLKNKQNLLWAYADVCYFKSNTYQTQGRVSQTQLLHSGNISRYLILKNFIVSISVIVHKSIFDTVGYFDERRELRMGEDWNMWLRIADQYPVGVLPEVLAYYRWHPASMTAKADSMSAYKSYRLIVENAISRNPKNLTGMRKQALLRLTYEMSRIMIRRGQYQQARHIIANTISEVSPAKELLFLYALTFVPYDLLDRVAKMQTVRRTQHNEYITL